MPNKEKELTGEELLLKDIEKYGKENFKTEILGVFDTEEEEANEFRAKLVNEEFVAREDTYNTRTGKEEEILECLKDLTEINYAKTCVAQRLWELTGVQVIHTYEFIKLQEKKALWLAEFLGCENEIEVDTDELGQWDFYEHELYNVHSFEWNGEIFTWYVKKDSGR